MRDTPTSKYVELPTPDQVEALRPELLKPEIERLMDKVNQKLRTSVQRPVSVAVKQVENSPFHFKPYQRETIEAVGKELEKKGWFAYLDSGAEHMLISPIEKVTVNVNGENHQVRAKKLSYEQVLELSGETGIVTVLHRCGLGGKTNTLTPGETTLLAYDSIFTACRT